MRRTIFLFVLGSALLFPFESTVPVTLGVLLLLATIVSGVFAVANPEFLAEEGEPPAQDG